MTRARANSARIALWALAGALSWSPVDSWAVCPAKLDDSGHVVESTVARISIDEAATRIAAGAGLVRLRTVRGFCLRIFDRSDPSMRIRSAYVENASGADLAAVMRRRQGAPLLIGEQFPFLAAWQRLELLRGIAAHGEPTRDPAPDVFDINDFALDLEFVRTADPSRRPFTAPESDPLRLTYFVADTTEVTPLSIVGPLVSYRTSGGVYVRDALNPRGYRALGPTPPTIAYRSRAFGLSGHALQAANEGLFAFFRKDEVASALHLDRAWEQLISLARPARRYFRPSEGFDAIDSILREILPGQVRWRDACFANGLCNFNFLSWDENRNIAEVEIGIPLNYGSRPDSASLHLQRLELRNPNLIAASWLNQAQRSGGFLRARMSNQASLRLMINDDPFARARPWIGLDER